MRALCFASLLIAVPAFAQPATPPPPCASAEHHQFDFWVGDWVVTNAADGKYVGQNRIDAVLGGCALHENWIGAKGGLGNSYNAFDTTRGMWHQTWVDASGGLLLLDGGFKDGKMVLEGEQKQPDGKPMRNRIAWTPMPDGRVEQRWDSTVDGGKTWQLQFDGIYARRSAGGSGSGASLRRQDI